MKRKDENRIFRSAMLRRFIWISAVLSLLILILAVSIMLLLETEVLHFLPALALMAFLCFLICCMFIAASLSFFRRLSELLSGIRRLAEGEPVHMYEEGIISELAKGLNQASEIQTRQKKMLEKRDDLRIEWIRGVSHDIRTPLSVALGYAEELEEDEDLTEEQRQEASLIKEQTLRIRELIEDLNLLSRLEYDSHPLRLRETAAAGLIRNAAAEMMNGQSILRDGREESVTMADFDMELMLLPEFERLSLKVDPALIRRVLRNIIGNCVRHNPDGCSIVIFAHRSKDRAFVDITDNGRGIPESVAFCINSYGSELWDESALEYSEEEDERGGQKPHVMGMRIAKRIMLSHGGSLMVKPDLHTVSLVFPL